MKSVSLNLQSQFKTFKYPAAAPEDWWSLAALCWPTSSIALLMSHTVTWESTVSVPRFLFADLIFTWLRNLNAMSPVKLNIHRQPS